ncbi:MAG: hypothetical protein U0V72_03485 [Cytophagales bacterium]
MTKNILLLFCLSLLTFSCKKLDKYTQFDLPYTQNVSIPSSTVANIPLTIATPAIKTNSSTKFSGYNTKADLIESVKLSSLVLVVKSPSGGDFSFLKDMEVYISANGLAEKKVAWKTSIPDNVGGSLTLDVSNEDLKEYIKKDEISLKVSCTTDEIITEQYSVDANMVFHVDAKILGI